MGDKYRINFISQYSGNYKVVDSAYLLDLNGNKLLPSGTLFSFSPAFNSTNDFEDGYRERGSWHSLYGTDPEMWGIVEFSTPQVVGGIYWRATSNDSYPTLAAERSPKDWSVEHWNPQTELWETLFARANEPVWSTSEIRTYGFWPITGQVRDLQSVASPRVILFEWENPEQFSTAIVASDGTWAAQVFHGRQYGIYYLSADNRCPPIIHGPYIPE